VRPRLIQRAQHLFAAPPVVDARALEVRHDDRHARLTADAERLLQRVQDAGGLGAQVGGVDGAGPRQGSARASTSAVGAAFAEA